MLQCWVASSQHEGHWSQDNLHILAGMSLNGHRGGLPVVHHYISTASAGFFYPQKGLAQSSPELIAPPPPPDLSLCMTGTYWNAIPCDAPSWRIDHERTGQLLL